MDDVEREPIVLRERVTRSESRRHRFDGIMPAAVRIAVILVVLVQILQLDGRADAVEQNQGRILDALDAAN